MKKKQNTKGGKIKNLRKTRSVSAPNRTKKQSRNLCSRAEAGSNRLNSVLRAIRDVNQLITREKNRDRLLQGVCDALIGTRGYHNVRIFLTDESRSAFLSSDKDWRKKFLPLIEQIKRGEMPKCGREALKKSGIVVIRNPVKECGDCSLTSMTAGRGVLASRLEHEGNIYGVLAASIPKKYLDDPEEKSLFEEVTGDIAFALHTVETEKKQRKAEAQLINSEGKYRALVTATAQIIWTTNAQGEVSADLPDFRAYTGQGYEQIKGWGWLSTMHPDDQKKTEETWSQAVRTQSVYEIEYRIRRHDGEYRWFAARGVPVLEKNKTIREWVGTLVDITERRNWEDMLRKQREEQQIILDSVPAWVFYKDDQNRFVRVNREFCEVMGMPKERLEGKSCFDLYPREQAEDFWRDDKEVIASGQPKRNIIEPMDNGGKTLWVQTDKIPFRDVNGNIVGILGFTLDITERKNAQDELKKHRVHLEELVKERTAELESEITERKQSEEALRKSEQKFRETVTYLDEGYYHCTMEGVLLDHNQAFNRILGFEIEKDLKGEKLPDFWQNPDDRKQYLDKFAAQGFVRNYLINAKKSDGEKITVLANAHVVKDATGRPMGIEGTFIDITDRVRAEAGLHLKNIVFESSIAANSIADKDGVIIEVNPAFLRLWGYESKEKAVGNSVASFFVNPDDAAPVIEALNTTGRWEGEFLAKQTDGKNFISRGMATAIRDEKGEMIGYQSANLDVTGERESEKLLKQTLEDLKHSNAELEQFAFVTSHDLQEPLRMVASYMQLIEKRYKGKLDADADEFIGYAVDGAVRMKTMINDLLNFSRLGTKGKEAAATDCQLIMSTVLTDLSMVIEESKAEITSDPLPLVKGDEVQLVRLFQNLIDNSIKFRGGNTPRIHISCKPQNGSYLFSIRDNGIGIDPRYFDRIFIIFQRLHGTDQYPGTGIGLAMCKKIVDRHRGKIWIESEPGKGTTFYFTLPGAS